MSPTYNILFVPIHDCVLPPHCNDLPTVICSPCKIDNAIPALITSSCPNGLVLAEESCSAPQATVNSGQLQVCQAGLSAGSQLDFGLNGLSGFPGQELIGAKFNFPANVYLESLPGGNVNLVSGQNTRETFTFDPVAETYSSTKNNTAARLTHVTPGIPGAPDSFTIRSSSGTKSEFHGVNDNVSTPGKLKQITDRYGRTQSFDWVANGDALQLKSQTDTYGRKLEYFYGSPLREVRDYLGRSTRFQYDEAGRLVGVVGPAITKAAGEPGTAALHGFPGGTGTVYQYDVANPRPDRRNDLIRVWSANQVAPFLNVETREIDIAGVYAQAKPQYGVEYGQDPTDPDRYGRVLRIIKGDPLNGVGGTYLYSYTRNPADLPTSIFYDPENPRVQDQIVSRTIVIDPNDNKVIYDLNPIGLPVRTEVLSNRGKSSLEASSFVTWRRFNDHNQEELVIYPEGNSVEREYDDGTVEGFDEPYAPRIGLLLRETQFPGNDYGIPSRAGSSGQTQLTRLYFYEPLFNQQCAMIESRGNPIDDEGTYFTPQNGGTTPTDENRSRYATITYYDYQKNTPGTVTGNAALQEQLDLDATQIQALIDHVNQDMIDRGLPAGFEMDLGDINGDGTGDGDSSGLIPTKILGSVVKIQHPSVLLVGGTTQERIELFTSNDRGQTTTHTDPEGNLTVYVYYPENDPEGDGQFVSETLSGKQYGRLKETHVDADPDEVMTLVGADGDLVDFIPGKITRTNTPGIYQDLTTRHSTMSGGCTSCAYDAQGNVLSTTDPRGFTTIFDRDELGRVYRTTSPAPYNFKAEVYYDANGNVIRQDIEDQVVDYESSDPADALYAKFIPSGNAAGGVAHVPMKPGKGGSIRPGWFTNRMEYDLLDRKTKDDIDATGSDPSRLVTTYEYDPNGNLITTVKPMGNTVEQDYDERNLRIATRVGYAPEADPPENGALTIYSYDGNGNLVNVISPTDRDGSTANNLTATIADAFRSGSDLTHTGDWQVQNVYDGFDRLILTRDAVGGTGTQTFDPDGRTIESLRSGTIGGASPTNRTGSGNVDLASSIARFDEAGRQYEAQQSVFLADGVTLPSSRSVTHTGGGLAANSTANNHTGTVTLTTGGESYVLARTVYDRAGRTVQQLADNTAITTIAYDGASRAILTTDALGNTVATDFDANGNALKATRTELCTIVPGAGAPDIDPEVFRSGALYDCLNRVVVTSQQGADGTYTGDAQTIFALVGYDSRNNRVLSIDPKGNTAQTILDGASRPLETRQQMRVSGAGDQPPAINRTLDSTGEKGGAIGTEMVHDANGRLTALIDDHGNATLYAYDSLDRQVRMTFPDGSTRVSVYDEAGDLTGYTDENGSAFAYSYDALGRRTTCEIERAEGVIGTTAQAWQYDGFSRVTFARDSVETANVDVVRVYDSLSRVLEEAQTQD